MSSLRIGERKNDAQGSLGSINPTINLPRESKIFNDEKQQLSVTLSQ